MAGGYGSQLVALDAMTPSELESQAAQADEAQSRAQIMRATAPAQIAIQQQQAVSGALNLQNQQRLQALTDRAVANALSRQQPTSQLASPATEAAPSPQLPTLFDPRVQQVMQSIDPTDPNAAEKWDQDMTALSNEVPQAKQFIGHYSRDMLNSPGGWLAQAGAHAVSSPLVNGNLGQITGNSSPLSALMGGAAAAGGGIQAASPLAGPVTAPQTGTRPAAVLSPATGQPDPTMTEMAIRFPKQAQELQSYQAQMMFAQTGDPGYLRRYAPDVYAKLTEADKNMTEAQKDQWTAQADYVGRKAQAIETLGQMAKTAGRDPNTDPAVRSAYNTAMQEAAQARLISPQEAQARMTSPIDWPWLAEKVVEANTVTSWRDSNPQVAAAKAAAVKEAEAPYEAHWISSGVDANGNAMELNTRTGQLRNTGTQVIGKQEQYYQFKHDSWLQAHPGDEQGAVAFAGGKKDLSPAQMAQIAQANAVKQQTAFALTNPGQQFDLQSAYQANLTALQQAAAAPTPAPPSTSATPNAAVGSAHGHTPAAHQAATTFLQNGTLQLANADGTASPIKGSPQAKVGTQQNPYFPKDQKQFDGLPKGTYFVGKDGLVYLKH